MRLPFAPRPHDGEALSSWVASLAAHNFVDAPTFAGWLTGKNADEVRPSGAVVRRLAEVSGLDRQDIADLDRQLRRAPAGHVLRTSLTTGLRGGACTACLEEADRAGCDQWLPVIAASIWTVTCKRHGSRLLELRGFSWRLDQGRLRLHHGWDDGQVRLRSSARPSGFLTICQAAFTRALLGRSPGRLWRTRDPRQFLSCAEALLAPVFWRAGAGGFSFARLFDEIEGYGRHSFYVNETSDGDVLAELAGEDVRTRASAVTAIGYLLLTSDALATSGWSRSLPIDATSNPFTSLLKHLNVRQHASLLERARDWPDCIARPLYAAAAEDGSRPAGSHLIRSTARMVAGGKRAKRRISDSVSSIAMQ